MLTCVRNRGELAEGWYDRATKEKANQTARDEPPRGKSRASPEYDTGGKSEKAVSESEDDFGPALPSRSAGHRKAGAVIPRMEDLQYRDGTFCKILSRLFYLIIST